MGFSQGEEMWFASARCINLEEKDRKKEREREREGGGGVKETEREREREINKIVTTDSNLMRCGLKRGSVRTRREMGRSQSAISSSRFSSQRWYFHSKRPIHSSTSEPNWEYGIGDWSDGSIEIASESLNLSAVKVLSGLGEMTRRTTNIITI